MENVTDLIERIKVNPPFLQDISPREFELVIAELLASFGWEVNVTQATRDGGYDVLGISTDLSGLQTSWMIECKKYSPDRKVGVDILRQLLGVKLHVGVPNGIIVTTSDFTNDAKLLVQSRNDLNLVEKMKIMEWVNKYRSIPAKKTYTASNSFFSCFISYSSKDELFAEKLAASLKQNNIKVWFAPEDIKPGEKIYNQVKSAISSFDKVLVILSENSMKSEWVKTELTNALSIQIKEKRQLLFPIALVPYEKIQSWELFESDNGIDVAKELRSYYIPDFTNWQDEKVFNAQIKKVTDALRKDETIKKTENVIEDDLSVLIQQFRGSRFDKDKYAREIGSYKQRAIVAIPALKKALKNPSGSVRDAAAWALGEIGTPEALKILEDYENS